MQVVAVRRQILEPVPLELVVWVAEQTERTVQVRLMQERPIPAAAVVVAVVDLGAATAALVSSFFACTPTSGRGCS
jgi:hypothetical protein